MESYYSWRNCLPGGEERLEFFDTVSSAEIEERLIGRATLHVCVEEALHERGKIRVGDRGDQIACQAPIPIGSAANHNLVSFFAAYLCAQQSDVTDVMLRAGMRAPGYVQVERLDDIKSSIEQVCEFNGMSLGVGRGKPASAISGARHGTA